jgi:Mn2+/Fe2+ NRAMP family transporter
VVVFGAAEALETHSSRAVMGVTTSLFFVIFGIALLGSGWGLTRAQTWARGPVMIGQLIALGLAWNFRTGDTTLLAVVLAVPAVIVLIGMLHPQSIAAMNDLPTDGDST